MADQLARDLARVQTTLLLKKSWHYLRYRHLRDALKLVAKDSKVMGLGVSSGMAEVALAMEFPRMQFLVTDSPANRVDRKEAEEAVSRYKLRNISFASVDIMRPNLRGRTFDLVYSIEFLHTLPDPAGAAANIRSLTDHYVMTLVPLGDAKNAAPRNWSRNAAAGNGMVLTQLLELFPNPMAIKGAYWANAGQKLREKLGSLSSDEIKAEAAKLRLEAEDDIKTYLPVKKSQALAFWTLALPNGV